MSWSIRHQGSPRSIDGLTVQQVVEGMQDGLWETTDEVMGPSDRQWVAIENHPQFADVAAEIEAPPPKPQEDETRLDMNPLIDVALVLLIFFILTTSYAAIQKVLDMPGTSATDPSQKVIKLRPDQVREQMVKVTARKENGQPVVKVEDETVPLAGLEAALSARVGRTKKTNLLIDAEGVDWGTVVAIQDAAKAADMQQVSFVRHGAAAKSPGRPK